MEEDELNYYATTKPTRAGVNELIAEVRRLQERLGPVSPGGDDRVDQLEMAVEFLRHDKKVLQEEVEHLKDLLRDELPQELYEELVGRDR